MNRFHWKAPAALAIVAILLVGAAGGPAEGAGQRRAAWAITGATVITSPGNTIENATVVVRDGLIEAVGAGVAAPPDARLIDGSGMTVYPGWIDAYSTIAIEEEEQGGRQPGQRGQIAAPGRGGRGGQQQLQDLELGAPGVNARVRSHYDVSAHIDGEDNQIGQLRDAGFTAALIVPEEGIYRGRSALIALRNAEASEIVIKSAVTQVVGFQTGGFGRGYPSSAMGVITLIRQVLLDAQRAATWESSYANDPTGIQRPEQVAELAALQPLLAGEQRVIFDASNTRTAKRALNISTEFNLQPIIKGNGNEYEMTEVLAEAGVAVIVPVDYPDKPTVSEDEEENVNIALADLQRWERAPGNAAALASAGVPFAFTSDGVGDPATFVANVRKAIDAGLSEDTALAALTTTPAQMLGVDSILGTIEPGKIANLVVATAGPFDEDSEVRHVFVDGAHTEVEASSGTGRPGGGGRAGGDQLDPRGTWRVTMGNGDFSQEMTWVIESQGGSYSGHVRGGDGSVVFDRVTLRGSDLTVAMTGPMGQVEVTVTIDGDQFSGDLDVQGFSIGIDGRRTSGPGPANDEHGGVR